MKRKITAFVVCLILIIGMLPMAVFAADNDNIVILYENDVHCEIEGYSKLSAMKKELQETYSHVGVVSGGDYIQEENDFVWENDFSKRYNKLSQIQSGQECKIVAPYWIYNGEIFEKGLVTMK